MTAKDLTLQTTASGDTSRVAYPQGATHTPGPWRLELKQEFPFGVKITSGDRVILEESAACLSTKQKTRSDVERGVGFDWNHKLPGFRRDAAIASIAEQDANARLITQSPALLAALRDVADWMNARQPEISDADYEIYRKAREVILAAEGRDCP